MNDQQIRQSMRESGEYRMRELHEFTVTKTEPTQVITRRYAWPEVYMLITDASRANCIAEAGLYSALVKQLEISLASPTIVAPQVLTIEEAIEFILSHSVDPGATANKKDMTAMDKRPTA